uniref:Uncharacterized protein n=1 Tax=Anguilla anguilla TaxID=7936 RepID=A0A0E9UDN0_ANGAN
MKSVPFLLKYDVV